MSKKQPIRIPVSKTFASAGLQTLESEEVRAGMRYCIQQVAWEIDKATSGGNTRCRLYIAGHGQKQYLKEEDGPTANALYSYAEPFFLVPNEKVALDIDQGQASTTAQMWLTGYQETEPAD